MSASAITVETVTAVTKQWPSSQLVEKATTASRWTSSRSVRLRPRTLARRSRSSTLDGKYDYIAIKTKADLTKAINAMKAIEKRAAKKAAAAAKKAS